MWKKIAYWVLVLIWLVVIFNFSAMTGANSDGQSKGFIESIATGVAHISAKLGMLEKEPTEKQIQNFAIKLNPLIRKVAHGTIYFVLAILLLLALFTNQKTFGRNMLITLAICFLYSLTDEWHQTFIPGRTGKFVDCLIDTLGVIIGGLVYLVPIKIFEKKKAEK